MARASLTMALYMLATGQAEPGLTELWQAPALQGFVRPLVVVLGVPPGAERCGIVASVFRAFVTTAMDKAGIEHAEFQQAQARGARIVPTIDVLPVDDGRLCFATVRLSALSVMDGRLPHTEGGGAFPVVVWQRSAMYVAGRESFAELTRSRVADLITAYAADHRHANPAAEAQR